mmetsp:Transcript_48757/g.156953  ORF Transcript_48757/g.156953 Transcript_48757/m.156953 type:complete len:640 (-) Transcript_48757:109-2028(-)
MAVQLHVRGVEPRLSGHRLRQEARRVGRRPVRQAVPPRLALHKREGRDAPSQGDLLLWGHGRQVLGRRLPGDARARPAQRQQGGRAAAVAVAGDREAAARAGEARARAEEAWAPAEPSGPTPRNFPRGAAPHPKPRRAVRRQQRPRKCRGTAELACVRVRRRRIAQRIGRRRRRRRCGGGGRGGWGSGAGAGRDARVGAVSLRCAAWRGGALLRCRHWNAEARRGHPRRRSEWLLAPRLPPDRKGPARLVAASLPVASGAGRQAEPDRRALHPLDHAVGLFSRAQPFAGRFHAKLPLRCEGDAAHPLLQPRPVAAALHRGDARPGHARLFGVVDVRAGVELGCGAQLHLCDGRQALGAAALQRDALRPAAAPRDAADRRARRVRAELLPARARHDVPTAVHVRALHPARAALLSARAVPLPAVRGPDEDVGRGDRPAGGPLQRASPRRGARCAGRRGRKVPAVAPRALGASSRLELVPRAGQRAADVLQRHVARRSRLPRRHGHAPGALLRPVQPDAGARHRHALPLEAARPPQAVPQRDGEGGGACGARATRRAKGGEQAQAQGEAARAGEGQQRVGEEAEAEAPGEWPEGEWAEGASRRHGGGASGGGRQAQGLIIRRLVVATVRPPRRGISVVQSE